MRRTYVAKGLYSAVVCFSALALSACHFNAGGGWVFGGGGDDLTSGSGGTGGSGGSGGDSGTVTSGGGSGGSNWPGTVTVQITAPSAIAKTVTFPTRFAQRGTAGTVSGIAYDYTCMVNVAGVTQEADEDDVLHPPCGSPSPTPTPTPCTAGDVNGVTVNYFESVDGTTCPVAATSPSHKSFSSDGASVATSTISVGICRNTSTTATAKYEYVYYSMPYAIGGDYSVRTGTIDYDGLAHSSGDSISLSLAGVTLKNYLGGDTIVANISIDGVELYPASSCR